jgi:HEAT repeat protein
MFGSHALALTIAAISLAFALAMAASIVALVIRRRLQERRALARDEEKLAASRALIRLLAGTEQEPLQQELPLGAWRSALSHLLRLIRGDERASLLALAERRGLFAEAIAGLRSPRRARRTDAMRLLEQFGSPECIAGLEKCLRTDRVMAVRLEAAAALARLKALPAVYDLVEALRMEEQPVTRLHGALFRSLAQRDAEQVAELASCPHHRALRPLLVEAMGWTSDLNMMSRLARHALDLDPEVRCAAIRAARHLGHPGSGQWIVSLLEDPQEAVRIQAAQACGQLRLKGAVASLEGLATESSWWVRTRARSALEVLRAGGRPALTVVKSAS